ncbi:MAG: radical SAM family heme chaperone HemW [Christensenellales bacterium]|nr:radical SAM family heme chaperone HemW [Christensenellales bacterium]
MNAPKKLALYLHIPFCASKCCYCDFASYSHRESVWADYMAMLKAEWRGWQGQLAEYELQTVFFGGGTPSILPAQDIAELLETVRRDRTVAGDAEITLEANPGTLTPEKLRLYREAGVNRLSIGAQSMEDRLLRALGRIHTAREVRDSVEMARDLDFENISLDLMYGLPGQTMADWMRTLEAAIALEPDHLSAYSLILEEGTPLAQSRPELPDDDLTVEMQRAAVIRLAQAGLFRYEISNFARKGRECRHNKVYWDRGEYLGLGCAAHSMLKGVRFENPRELEAYLDGQRQLNRRVLTRSEEMVETLMLSTRLCRGLDLEKYRAQFGVRFEEGRRQRLDQLEAHALAETRDGFFRLTGKGLELQNAVVVELMDDEG